MTNIKDKDKETYFNELVVASTSALNHGIPPVVLFGILQECHSDILSQNDMDYIISRATKQTNS